MYTVLEYVHIHLSLSLQYTPALRATMYLHIGVFMCMCIYIIYTYRYIVACPNAAEPFEVVEEGSAPPAAQGKSTAKDRAKPATKGTYATEVLLCVLEIPLYSAFCRANVLGC